MIYTRFLSTPVEIVARLGLHSPEFMHFDHPQILLLVKEPQENAVYARWLFSLRADNGLSEIMQATNNAPEWQMSYNFLKGAFADAQ